MTTNELLERLRKQRELIDASISMITHMLHEENHHVKRASIIRSVKRGKRGLGLGINQPSVHKVARGRKLGRAYKPGTHWMQKPENRERVLKQLRKMRRAQRTK